MFIQTLVRALRLLLLGTVASALVRVGGGRRHLMGVGKAIFDCALIFTCGVAVGESCFALLGQLLSVGSAYFFGGTILLSLSSVFHFL